MNKFTEEELEMIDSALYHAIEDIESYLRDGFPERDMDEDSFEKLKAMPDKWLALRRKIAARG